MFESTETAWRHLLGTSDRLGERLQTWGLAEAAKWARRWMDVPELQDPTEWADWERDVLAHLLERLCHYPGADAPDPSECGAFEETLDFLQTLPIGRRRQLHHLLAILEVGSQITAPDGERRRFSQLEAEAADTYLRSWAQSDLPPRRAVFQGVKSICMMGYWSRPETWDSIGYSLEANPGLDTDDLREHS